ncbi:UNVERIFIED_CONTAM: hypothetical protein HDU68_006677 [Siphonaria sp. JEL0065]|nr:hypothetical protein HDU68_006677 [Siphonaria sp. JEL0065]
MGSAFSTTVGPAALEQVSASKASKQRARIAIESAAQWRQKILGFSDSIDKCSFAGALWAEDERDIPFSKAFKSLSLTATELTIVSGDFLEALDNHENVLAGVLALQREHHDSIKRVAKQQKIFREVKQKLGAAQFIKRSSSTVDLMPTRINDKKRNRNRKCVDPEEIFTGVDALDFASEVNARRLLDELILLEHSKWEALSDERDAKLVETFHSLFLAESGMWTKFSQVFERMKRICVYYAKVVSEVNSVVGATAKMKNFTMDGIESRNVSARRRSVTVSSDQAFASKQQKLLIFQNPETNIVICKKRLKMLKRWHYLSQITLQLWLEMRESEQRHVKACIDWLTQDGQCHSMVRSYSFYESADGTEPVNPVSKREYISMLKGWADILKTLPSSETAATNNLNLAKPLMVVQNCMQYVERTLFNVNEREKSALDQVKKLAASSGKSNFFARAAQDESRTEGRRMSLIGPKANVPPSSHASDVVRHKLDKILVENRVFRRTKLAKSQTELWRGLEFCTKFMGTLYFYLGSEHQAKLPFKFEDDDSVTFGIPSNIPKPLMIDEAESIEPNSGSIDIPEAVQVEELKAPEITVDDPTPQPITPQNPQISQNRLLGASSQSSLSVAPMLSSRLSVSRRFTNAFTKSMSKIHPDATKTNEGAAPEFDGLSKQDEQSMISQASLLLNQIDYEATARESSANQHPIVAEYIRRSSNHNMPKEKAKSEKEIVSSQPAFVVVVPTSFTDVSRKFQAAIINTTNTGEVAVCPDLMASTKKEDITNPGSNEVMPSTTPSIEITPTITTFPTIETAMQSPDSNMPSPVDPKKKHKKKKRHPSRTPDKTNPLSPSAPPAELMDGSHSPSKRHRSRHSSNKKSKGPPPPPPMNPAAIESGLEVPVSRLNAPMMTVSSASMTNTRLIMALSNGDIAMHEGLIAQLDISVVLSVFSPIVPTELPLNLVAPVPAANTATPSLPDTNIANVPLTPAFSTVPPPPSASLTSNILDNELKALAPRAISPDQSHIDQTQQNDMPSIEVPTKQEPSQSQKVAETSIPSVRPEVKYVQLPGLGTFPVNQINSQSASIRRSNSSLDSKGSLPVSDRRPPPEPPQQQIRHTSTVSQKREEHNQLGDKRPVVGRAETLDRPHETRPTVSRGSSLNAPLASNFGASKSDFFRLPKDKALFSASHRNSIEQLAVSTPAPPSGSNGEYYRIPKNENSQMFRQSISRRGSIEQLNAPSSPASGNSQLNALSSSGGGAGRKSQLFQTEASSTAAATYVLHAHRRPAPEPPRQPYPSEGPSNPRNKNLAVGGGGLRNAFSSSTRSVIS